MDTGIIVKALSGFYYVRSDEQIVECRARGRFRLDGTTPLVGDRVDFRLDDNAKGVVVKVHERKNSFLRPAVANIDCLVVLASAVNPITDPFIIDSVTSVAESKGCEVVICINKADLDSGDALFEIYKTTAYTLLRTSALTGQGIDELKSAIAGKVCAFTGNSGVGKSSILNALSPELNIKVGEVSAKLGRGRHTTRHVELFDLTDGASIADTPGFSSFEMEKIERIPKEELQYSFNEFGPFLGRCRFQDCSHRKEPSCAVVEALALGSISRSRYNSYVRLYDIASQFKDWEAK